MKSLFYIFLLFVLSPIQKNDFIYGQWELGQKNGQSQFTISSDHKLTWKIGDFIYVNNEPFDIHMTENEQFVIQNLSDKNEGSCFKLVIEKENENLAILSIIKCHIHPSMIDEIALMRREGISLSRLKPPLHETIVLPEDLRGEFYLIYEGDSNKFQDHIQVNPQGLGIFKRNPNMKQFVQPNRTFKFIGHSEKIKILNAENNRNQNMDSNIQSTQKKMVIIQKGFNQTPRKTWNKKNKIVVPPHVNIEYFEIVEV